MMNSTVIKKSFTNFEGTKSHSIPCKILPPYFRNQLHAILILIPKLFDSFSPSLNCCFCLLGNLTTLRLVFAALFLLEIFLNVCALFVLGKNTK